MRVVARFKNCALDDNCSPSETWTETAVFDSQEPIAEIFAWADKVHNNTQGRIKLDIMLTIDTR